MVRDLVPSRVPVYGIYGPKPSGIGIDGFHSRDYDFCFYHTGPSKYILKSFLGVFDHEIGHAWGVDIEPHRSNGCHWLDNSTVHGQMGGGTYIDTLDSHFFLYGNDIDGFYWREKDINLTNEKNIYSDPQLYLMGLHPYFPDTYVLEDLEFHPNNVVSYTSATKYDHQYIVDNYGIRDPDYTQSPKNFNLGFIYAGRDSAEIFTNYINVEKGIRFFTYSDSLDTKGYRFVTSFLKATKNRASVNSRLADLDGNIAPIIFLFEDYLTCKPNTIQNVEYNCYDADGHQVTIECLDYNEMCIIENNNISIHLPDTSGTYFLTFRITDEYGKQAFDHMVIDAFDETNQPTLILPQTDSSVYKNVTLQWSNDHYAQNYQVQISTSENFNNIVYDFKYNDTTVLIKNLELNKEYYWRVRSLNQFFESIWSDINKFNTEDKLIADFKTDVVTGIKPLTLHFIDNSIGDITSWYWEFGDDNTSTEQNPQHTYMKADTFTVSLTVTGPLGENTKTKQQYIVVSEPAPTANFFADPISGDSPLEVKFIDSSTGAITSWLWDFGDGGISTEQNPTYIYVTGDSFTVSLTIAGPGGKDTFTLKNYIYVNELTNVARNGNDLPTKFKLHPNYPNPFNPQTQISFDIPEKSNVKLIIYNINGRIEKVLINQILMPGNYKILWDASNKPSGTYFIQIKTEKYQKIQKCILIR